jgi:hypothetical protein
MGDAAMRSQWPADNAGIVMYLTRVQSVACSTHRDQTTPIRRFAADFRIAVSLNCTGRIVNAKTRIVFRV